MAHKNKLCMGIGRMEQHLFRDKLSVRPGDPACKAPLLRGIYAGNQGGAVLPVRYYNVVALREGIAVQDEVHALVCILGKGNLPGGNPAEERGNQRPGLLRPLQKALPAGAAPLGQRRSLGPGVKESRNRALGYQRTAAVVRIVQICTDFCRREFGA